MKYVKHMTLKEWNRFNKILKDSDGNFIPPGNEFQFRNHFTGKMESLTTITTQEVLLSKYKIVLDGFEPKWKRRYHAIAKVVNMKNFDKGMKTFDKSMQAFSKGVGEIEKDSQVNTRYPDLKQDKKNQEILWGKKSKSKSKKAKKEKSVDEILFGKKSKGRTKNSLKIWSDDKVDLF